MHGNAKNMRWILLSPGIMSHEVATLVHNMIESSKPVASKPSTGSFRSRYPES